MSDLAIILSARRRMLANAIQSVRGESRLKVAFISTFVVAFWACLFEGFREAFFYIGKVPGFENIMTALVFSLFFLSLLIMLVFSNAVLIYGSLYRSAEVDFLMTLPVRRESIFLYKLIETVVYSSWAFIYLGVPVVIAFGVSRGGPWYFYPAALAMFCVFVAIPAAVASLISMLLVNFVPRTRMATLATCGIAAFAVIVFVAMRYFSAMPPYGYGYSELSRILSKVTFCQHPLLPSLWLSKGVLSLAKAQPKWALFYAAVILSNSLFLTAVAQAASRGLFMRGFSLSRSAGARRVLGKGRFIELAMRRVFFFLPLEIRLFLAKDLRVFLRDRLQWGQFLIFFGVLAIYIANIRSFPYNLRIEQARSGISLLNLGATCLVLSTFTGRFIFPLLSLEGRNFWVLGLAPVKRSMILYGKFCFAFFGSLVVSESLISLSDYMLRFPASMWLLHATLVLAICSGLAAISVGLGARYPNLKEDNPAKIVGGFGGTLNLIVSMLYIAVMIAVVAVPCHVAFAPREDNPALYVRATALYLALSAVAGGLTSLYFLNIGRKAFDSMEM